MMVFEEKKNNKRCSSTAWRSPFVNVVDSSLYHELPKMINHIQKQNIN